MKNIIKYIGISAFALMLNSRNVRLPSSTYSMYTVI